MAKPTRVTLLDGGAMFAKKYQLFWSIPSEAPITIPSYGVLIDHQDGLFLFDTAAGTSPPAPGRRAAK